MRSLKLQIGGTNVLHLLGGGEAPSWMRPSHMLLHLSSAAPVDWAGLHATLLCIRPGSGHCRCNSLMQQLWDWPGPGAALLCTSLYA